MKPKMYGIDDDQLDLLMRIAEGLLTLPQIDGVRQMASSDIKVLIEKVRANPIAQDDPDTQIT